MPLIKYLGKTYYSGSRKKLIQTLIDKNIVGLSLLKDASNYEKNVFWQEISFGYGIDGVHELIFDSDNSVSMQIPPDNKLTFKTSTHPGTDKKCAIFSAEGRLGSSNFYDSVEIVPKFFGIEDELLKPATLIIFTHAYKPNDTESWIATKSEIMSFQNGEGRLVTSGEKIPFPEEDATPTE